MGDRPLLPIDAEGISFRPLFEGDLDLLHRWLNTPHVLEWWANPGPTREQVAEEYAPRVLKEERVECFVMMYGERPIGFIQQYPVDDANPYAPYVPSLARAAGIDLFIGEPDLVHRGLGSALIRRFLEEVVFAGDVSVCVIDPSERNRIAIRAYEKAHFRHIATFQQEGERDRTYLMIATKETVTNLGAHSPPA
jgi:RimJ/RimL family protein N-acetyltransferase